MNKTPNSPDKPKNDDVRKSVLKILADTANGCLAELGYFPGIVQRLHAVEHENTLLRADNIKMFADNRRLAELAVQQSERNEFIAGSDVSRSQMFDSLRAQIAGLTRERDDYRRMAQGAGQSQLQEELHRLRQKYLHVLDELSRLRQAPANNGASAPKPGQQQPQRRNSRAAEANAVASGSGTQSSTSRNQGAPRHERVPSASNSASRVPQGSRGPLLTFTPAPMPPGSYVPMGFARSPANGPQSTMPSPVQPSPSSALSAPSPTHGQPPPPPHPMHFAPNGPHPLYGPPPTLIHLPSGSPPPPPSGGPQLMTYGPVGPIPRSGGEPQQQQQQQQQQQPYPALRYPVHYAYPPSRPVSARAPTAAAPAGEPNGGAPPPSLGSPHDPSVQLENGWFTLDAPSAKRRRVEGEGGETVAVAVTADGAEQATPTASVPPPVPVAAVAAPAPAEASQPPPPIELDEVLHSEYINYSSPSVPPGSALPPAESGTEEEEESKLDEEGLRSVEDCLEVIFEREGDEGLVRCRLCRARVEQGVLGEDATFVNPSLSVLEAHCTSEHAHAWNAIRDPQL